jgi:hypothetical protein
MRCYIDSLINEPSLFSRDCFDFRKNHPPEHQLKAAEGTFIRKLHKLSGSNSYPEDVTVK